MERILHTKRDIQALSDYLGNKRLPVTVTVKDGKHRSLEQNRLQRLWCNEVAEQLGDRTPEDVRGECKLRMGVPILRAENEAFREKYDRLLKPMSYEDKVALMMEPLNIPITRIMTVSQMVRYLDHVLRFWTEQGMQLTQPDSEFRRDVERYSEC